jgi:four helix bundle protein
VNVAVDARQLFSVDRRLRFMLSFQSLDVYQRSADLLTIAVEITRSVPRGSGPTCDQLKRAATSVLLNIAEAAGRTGRADAARAYAIARGSAMETAAALHALRILEVVDERTYRRATELAARIVAMLTKLCR